MTEHYDHSHPANIARHDDRPLGARASDRVTSFMGSWKFIGVQTALIAAWIGLNVFAVSLQWDPYPWILLNLLFSIQAAYASPLILLAQNRQTEHDRQAAEVDYANNAESLRLLHDLVAGQRDIQMEL